METDLMLQEGVPMHVGLIQLALSKGAGVDQLEKLLALQERFEANEARKAYVAAMAAFKANPPRINKDKHVSFGNTEYDHASLANVTETINSALSSQGLSAAWKTTQSEKMITVTCCITHILGHQECTSLSALPDDSGKKNQIQSVGSTVSYLSRYTLLSLTGLATHDQDTDGATSEPQAVITTDQISALAEICDRKGYDADEKLLALAEKVYRISSISQLPASKFEDAKKRIEKLSNLRQPGEEG